MPAALLAAESEQPSRWSRPWDMAKSAAKKFSPPDGRTVSLTPTSRSMIQHIDPDALNLVVDPKHLLYQKDAANDPPEWMVMSAMDHGIFTPITIRKGPVVANVQTWD